MYGVTESTWCHEIKYASYSLLESQEGKSEERNFIFTVAQLEI